MSLERVERWRSSLRAIRPELPDLSEAGARFALDAALDALDDLPRHLDRPAPAHTVLVAASTVFTAPLEWAAVLLARGGAVTLKAPRALEPWFAQVAAAGQEAGLPLSSTLDRGVIPTADRVVAMGSDATLDALRAALPDPSRLLGFGHRWSVAFWSDPTHAEALALDLALYDGRGCMSPLAVFSPLPDAGGRLADALASVSARLPRGSLSAGEHARVRERIALARVLGRSWVGAYGAVCELPADRFVPDGLPRCVVVHPASHAEALERIRAHVPRLAVLGTDRPFGLDAREVSLGAMQRPPLDRLHDGVPWLEVV